ncbi:short-chain oxidoreductase [Paenibacillus sp. sptzw28]|uniref:IucA/IucC family protein n=1 Tax=Paenibacillus sp. sptzw28 TaxID=715179 RepID=UPI001C6F18B4|nr:IucA/IucC family protein [Paenibacillus sp. sptzw28]QYR19456.1 short-chain oxidoreductase [Paenibacillus sp. sptzw28]
MQVHSLLPDAGLISLRLAERASVRGLLNSFFREIGVFDIRGGLPETGFLPPVVKGETFSVQLPHSKKWITGMLDYYSMAGQHLYGDTFYTSETGGSFTEVDTNRLIGTILEEVSLYDQDVKRSQRLSELRGQIDNSLRKMRLYMAAALENADKGKPGQPDYIASEQSLLAGHPFHPTPKSSEGFSDEELPAYAPELRAAFRLHYFAASDVLIAEERLSGYDADPIPSEVINEARRLLQERCPHYRLIPLHPWQAQYVKRDERVQRMLADSTLVDLGPLGSPVYPTSSVRTVWDPGSGYFFKLPLHVRITNFIRENTAEQVRRTMDAAKILNSMGIFGCNESFQILPEIGFVGIRGGSDAYKGPHETDVQLFASFAVVFRKAHQLVGRESGSSFVVASLLECLPGEREPKLLQAVRRSGGGNIPDPDEWLAAYLRISMLPLLKLFADYGVSLEAHVQNSLVTIENGVPSRFYVRDLEGVSIVRDRFEHAEMDQTVVSSDSPVLYSEEEAWSRLKYYFFVNHLGSVIHTVAWQHHMGEGRLWKVVRSLLEKELKETKCFRLSGYIEDLLANPILPAKANLISRFQERGETPLYVDIPNSIYHCKEEL